MLLFCLASCLVLSVGVATSDPATPSVNTPTESVTPSGGPSDPSAHAVGAVSVNGAATPAAPGEVSVNGKHSTETPTLVEPLSNLTVVNGSFAELSCVARADGRNVVIVWLKSDEFKVLFYGSSRVTEDKRLSVRLLVEDGKTESTLRISPVLDVDQSKYICRLPRKEKIYTESMYLTVIPAESDSNTTSVTDSSEYAASTSLQPPLGSSQSPSPGLPTTAKVPSSTQAPDATVQSTTTAQPVNGASSTSNSGVTEDTTSYLLGSPPGLLQRFPLYLPGPPGSFPSFGAPDPTIPSTTAARPVNGDSSTQEPEVTVTSRL